MEIGEWFSLGKTAAEGIDVSLKVVGQLRKMLKTGQQAGGSFGSTELMLQMDDMVERLTAARGTITALSDANAQFEKENVRLKQFQIERENYELRAIAPQSFAYVAKTAVADDQNAPKFCTHCFDRCERSILQLKSRGHRLDTLHCPSCGNDYRANNGIAPEVRTVRVKRSASWDGF